MTATIAIIILEVTGDFQYLPPLAIAVIVANVVSSSINSSLYHSLIHFKYIPFLEDMGSYAFQSATAATIMASPVVTLKTQCSVRGARGQRKGARAGRAWIQGCWGRCRAMR
jgi:hypothetical protein